MDKIFNLVKEIQDMYEKSSQLAWTLYTTGYDFGIEEIDKKIMDKLSSKDDFKLVKELYERKDLSKEDKRRAEIVYKMYEPYHLSKEVNNLSLEMQKLTTKLSSILNTFRSKIDGKEISSVEINNILRTEPDENKRKQAFEARCQVNEKLVEGGFIDLIKMRNKYAKLRGFNDFVDFKLDCEELDSDIFKNWKEQLHSIVPKMKEAKAKVAKKYLNKENVEPWDSMYLTSMMAPSLNKNVDMTEFYKTLREFFIKFGFNLDEYNITYDIFSRKNKSEWGYNFPISVGKDSRVLANVKNNYNEYGVLLHETGHGVHFFQQDPKEIILNSAISGIITEGIANLFGSFLYDESFFGQFFDDTTKVKEELNNYKEYAKINSLSAITSIMFDQNLYRTEINTLEDINNLAKDTYKEYMLTDFPGDFPWGYRIHHTTHPIYLHNYFMGDVTCEMLKKVFLKNNNCDRIMDKPKKFGEFLVKNVIDPSGLYTYGELFNKISGEDFSLKYMM